MKQDIDLPPADGSTDDNGGVMPRARRVHRKKDGAPPRDAASLAAEAIEGEADPTADQPKRRKKRAGGDDLNRFAERIFGFHQLAAVMTNSPELMIDGKEATALAIASTEVMAEFDISIGGKYAAVFGLVATAGGIYFPRMVARLQRLQREKATAERQAEQEAAARTVDSFSTDAAP